MPAGDQTGPQGAGPRGGEATGHRAAYSEPGFGPTVFCGIGSGLGWGRGRGRGWRHRFYATGLRGWARFGWDVHPRFGVPPFHGQPSMEAEAQALRNQAEQLEMVLAQIRRQVADIESATEKGRG
jgi:hypothetical protein